MFGNDQEITICLLFMDERFICNLVALFLSKSDDKNTSKLTTLRHL